MFKNLIRQLTPPIFFAALKSLYRRFNPGTPIYDGFYRDRASLPRIDANPFAHPNWISYVSDRAQSRIAGVMNQDMHEMCFSLIASIRPPLDEPGRQVIVDFGGGVVTLALISVDSGRD